jgi:glycosyltransferase involved in cell wall biosynthesis
MKQYICAFRGRRDNYQIPLALAEHNLLDQFITDFYAIESLQKIITFFPKSWFQKVIFRYESRIPTSKVKCLWRTTLFEHTLPSLGFTPTSIFALLDQSFSKEAISRTNLSKSNLLLYTPYAWEAFLSSYKHNPRKVLFEYHPHPEFEHCLLADDLQRFPYVEKSYKAQTRHDLPEKFQIRMKDCWKHADRILCASNFTKKTLIAAGAEPSSCHVISYGIDCPVLTEKKPNSNKFQALFVGSGIQRKGLHHLLYAWQRASLPHGSQLILVCRNLDPGIEPLIQETPNVQLIRGTNIQELANLYQTSHLFVMPSLVEGFGQVFLESLSYGCPVLGTSNTCLPDLGDHKDGIFITEVGNIDELTYELEYLAQELVYNSQIRFQARACAERFSWENFRNQLVNLL